MKRQLLIVLSIILVSCVCIYIFNPWKAAQNKSVIPKGEEVVVKPETEKPNVKLPEVVKPEVKGSEIPDIIIFESTKGNVTFNHSAHAEAYACEDCHHAMSLEEGGTPQKCKECHEKPFSAFHTKSSTYSCVGCHTKAGAGPSYTPCSGCHKK